MSKNDNRTYDSNAVQNRFTAYLKNAVHNKRIDYLYKKANPSQFELPIEDLEQLPTDQLDFTSRIAEYDTLQWALRLIKERERYILLARVIEGKDFQQIGTEVGLSYKGTAAVFYRTLAKLRKLIGGN